MLTLPRHELLETPWLCEGKTYQVAQREIERLLQSPPTLDGLTFPEPEFPQMQDGVFYIPIRGTLLPYQNIFSRLYGHSTLDDIEMQIALALSNDAVRAIVLEIDSPGGDVTGIAELARTIRGTAARRPTFAHCRRALSAGYWLASACGFIVAADENSEFGSIGAVVQTKNLEAQAAQQGERYSIFSTGILKTVGNVYQKMTDEGSRYLQNKTLDIGLAFLQALQNYRPGMFQPDGGQLLLLADGASYFSQEALTLGLIDGQRTAQDFHQLLLSGGNL